MTSKVRSILSLNALLAAFISLTLGLAAPCLLGQSAQEETGKRKKTKVSAATQTPVPVIWRDPGAVETLDFVWGIGGRENAPKPPFTFIEENFKGTNPKVDVKDANGVKWKVKFGQEVNAEVFATRMAWAAGYFVDTDYYVGGGKILGASGLARAKKYIARDGSFDEARFESKKEKGVKKLEEEESWQWDKNPFVGTKELNGLKVVMMLTSNFDNKDVRDVHRGSNTAILIYPVNDGLEARYLVTDWGGSMGKWGGYFSRGKWDCKGFAHQSREFIKGVKKGYVEWGFSGQHTKGFVEDISVNDVKWLYQYLGRVTDNQLRAGLQASGATPDEVVCFTQAMRERLNQMKNLQ